MINKFKFSFIVPIKYIRSFGVKGDFTLALSHLIDLKKENEYEKAIKEISLPIWLDNGLFENHSPEELNSLLDKAKKIKATTVFSPDYLYDSKRTKAQIDETYNLMKEKGVISKMRLGVIVQAENRKDWLQQYIDFTNDNRVNLIGLSILSIPFAYKLPITEARIACIKDLLELKIKHKFCHLLGLGSSYDDIKFAMRFAPFIVSNDSSSCFQTGLKELYYDDEMQIPGGKIEEKIDFDLKGITSKQMHYIYTNIKKVREL